MFKMDLYATKPSNIACNSSHSKNKPAIRSPTPGAFQGTIENFLYQMQNHLELQLVVQAPETGRYEIKEKLSSFITLTARPSEFVVGMMSAPCQCPCAQFVNRFLKRLRSKYKLLPSLLLLFSGAGLVQPDVSLGGLCLHFRRLTFVRPFFSRPYGRA